MDGCWCCWIDRFVCDPEQTTVKERVMFGKVIKDERRWGGRERGGA